MFTLPIFGCKRNRLNERTVIDARRVGSNCYGGEAPGRLPGRQGAQRGALTADIAQARRVRTKFWPAALVQFNWLVDTSKQLKLIGDWRISEVPVISTEVGPVNV